MSYNILQYVRSILLKIFAPLKLKLPMQCETGTPEWIFNIPVLQEKALMKFDDFQTI